MALPMPPVTSRLHPPRNARTGHVEQWLGDSPAYIDLAGKQEIGRDGGRYIDINLQRVGAGFKRKNPQLKVTDTAYGLHWESAKKNGFLYIETNALTKKRRPMTTEELFRHVEYWDPREVKKWRRTLKAERGNYASTVRPYTYAELVRYCRRRRVIPCFELKSRSFADLEFAKRMHKVIAPIRWQVYFMALVNMADCREKGEAFVGAGEQFAVLAHGMPRPKDFSDWTYTRVWGSFKGGIRR